MQTQTIHFNLFLSKLHFELFLSKLYIFKISVTYKQYMHWWTFCHHVPCPIIIREGMKIQGLTTLYMKIDHNTMYISDNEGDAAHQCNSDGQRAVEVAMAMGV